MIVLDQIKMDILTSVRAVNYVFQAFTLTQLGFNMAEKRIKRNRFLQLYTLLIVIVELIIMIYGILFRNIEGSISQVANTVDWIKLIGIRLVGIIAAIESLVSTKDQQLFFELMQNIDRTIENTFNYKFDHKRARLKSITYGLGMLSLYMGCELFLLYSIITLSDLTISYWFQYLLPLLFSGSRYFQICFYVNLIDQRIIIVNNFLSGIKLDQAALPAATVKLFNINSKGKQGIGYVRLVTIRELYNKLYEVTKVFNKCYGLSILGSVANDFLSITSNCYWMFLTFQSSSNDFTEMVGSPIWSIPHLFPVLLLTSVCHRAEQNVS